ncbi:LysR family transcriptional regulator [Sodalis sp. dw_96]|uniref:LysR family transcriptional regulator n=1 Tax=Sodalis sp. dw_96 TaxID=2719794 RepID=UPI001BD31BF9|nr:LysR family transcriptional regulator [Sodalis sp. dw_96]
MVHSPPAMLDIATFIVVAQNASFTRAAEQLGTSKSNVGKAVQRLELRLGTSLFQRTTRVVRLTEDGEIYLQAARMALDGLSEAETALAARHEDPAGRVRLNVPAGLGRLFLPTFAAIRKRYPKITLEFTLNDRHVDAVGEGWDIVVRIGQLPAEGEMTVRKLCDLRLGLYASAAYLKQRDPITSVKQLSDQQAIMFRSISGRLRPWTLWDGGQTLVLSPDAAIILSDGGAMVDAAVNGLGIAQLFDRVAQPHVISGALQHLLPKADTEGAPVHALIPVGHRMPPKTRVILDHLADVLRLPLEQ